MNQEASKECPICLFDVITSDAFSHNEKRLDSPPELASPTGLASCITKRSAVSLGVHEANGEKPEQFLVKDYANWDENQPTNI